MKGHRKAQSVGGMVMAWGPLLAGCAAPQPTPATYEVVRLESSTPAESFRVAERVLRARFHLDRRDAHAGILTTTPFEYSGAQQAGRLGDVLQVPRHLRRVADVRVRPGDSGAMVYCRVLVQENEAQAHQLFVRDHASTDVPTDTPIDRGAATTTAQNSVWHVRGRDRALERELLRAIETQSAD